VSVVAPVCDATPQAVAEAARLLREGRLVAFPTETVYGLGANALDPIAVERIFAAKGRPPTIPLIVHVDSVEMARGLVIAWPDAAATLTASYWPGPLTLVLPKQQVVPDAVTAGLPTVGIRMPAHPVALELIRLAGVPVAAPSANPFSGLSPTTAEHVRESLAGQADFVLDGGPSRIGIESTVVSLACTPPQLLRPGMVSRADIEALIGAVEVAAGIGNGAHPSPGMHLRHYSPRTPLIVIEPGDALPPGRGVCLACTPGGHRRMPSDPAFYAAALYATLHELDRQGLDWIAVEQVPDTPEWTAIRDRLRRASNRQP
jgi:L-threonylcarbamoyladenylate synthase